MKKQKSDIINYISDLYPKLNKLLGEERINSFLETKVEDSDQDSYIRKYTLYKDNNYMNKALDYVNEKKAMNNGRSAYSNC